MAEPIKQQIKNIEENQKKRSLDYSIKEGISYSAMVGFGENYIPAYAVALNANNTEIGLLSSIPHFMGSCVQLISARIVDKYRKRKAVIVASVTAQALMFIPIILAPLLFKSKAAVALIFFAAAYQIFGQSVSPPWNSLMGDLVPADRRGEFFGRRSKAIGFTAFMTFLLGGFVIEYFHEDKLLMGFALVFLAAMASRFLSAVFNTMIYEPKYEPLPDSKVKFSEFLGNIRKTQFGTFTSFLFWINFAVYLSNPFFVVYMLRSLGFSYMQFTLVTAANVIVTYSAMYYWGRYSDALGNMRIMSITGWLIPLNPLLWLLPFGFWYILLVQVWTGFVWAGFAISTSNFIFDSVESRVRAKMVSYYNFLMGIAVFAGAALGGLLVSFVFTSPWIFLSNLQFIFLISGMVRIASCIIFLPKLREVRITTPSPSDNLFIDLIAIKPMQKIAAELVIGINTIRDAGKAGYETSVRWVEIGKAKLAPKPSRILEINEVLKKIDFMKRKEGENTLSDAEREWKWKKRWRQKKLRK